MNMQKDRRNINSTASCTLLLEGVLGQVFRKFLHGGLFAVVLILSGCVSSLPGGYKTYCIDGGYSKDIISDYEYVVFTYDRYFDLDVGGSGIKCNVVGLHPMHIKWKKKGGDDQETTIDIAKLMEEMRQRQDKRFPVSDGWPHIELYYKHREITVFYIIYSAIPRKAGRKRSEYILTTIQLN